MGEMLQLQVGQCGNRVGTRFWQSLCAEHGLDASGNSVSDVPERTYGRKAFFNESKEGQYSPRALLVDMEPGALDAIRAGPSGRLFTPDQYVFDTCGTGNLFVRGRYTVGLEFAESVLDGVRRLIEATDCLHGFQFVHALGGGTGSGLGSLLLSRLREEFPERINCTHTLFPSPSASDSVIEIYNTILAIEPLVQNCDMVAMLDNESLFSLAHWKQSIESPTYADLNHLISDSMGHMTCSMRFHGILNSNLRKLAVNLVPFPRLHFLNVIVAPLSTRGGESERLPVPEMIESLFDFDSSMSRAKAYFQVTPTGLAASVNFRGGVSSYEVEHGLATAPIHNRDFFYVQIPDPMSFSICSVPAVDRAVSASLLLNSNFVEGALLPMTSKFTAMFRRKAFLHWYTAEGMDEMEFTEAESNANDLLSEYWSLRDWRNGYQGGEE